MIDRGQRNGSVLERMRDRRNQEESVPQVLSFSQGQGEPVGVLMAGELAVMFGEAKGGKSRAAVALLAWERVPNDEVASILKHWELHAPEGLRYYFYHTTETRYIHLVRYAQQFGAGNIAQDNFLPFKDTKELEEALAEVQKKAARAKKPALVVVDSLIKLVPSEKSENEANVMDKVMGALKECLLSSSDQPWVAVIVIHHTTKDGRSPRGSVAIEANADHLLELTRRSENGQAVLIYQKGRGDVPKEFEKILSVSVGTVGKTGNRQKEAERKKKKKDCLSKARKHFQKKPFRLEELKDFMKEIGCSPGTVDTWKYRGDIVSDPSDSDIFTFSDEVFHHYMKVPEKAMKDTF